MDENSDIDLFIELYSNDNKDNILKQSNLALKEFLKSENYNLWKLRNVDNVINCFVGTLKKQTDLKRSLISEGIVLYGKYFNKIKGSNYSLFSLEVINEKNKRYKVFRRLFGRNEKIIKTKGIVKELGGKQISTRVFLIPLKQAQIILKYLRKEKVNYHMIEITKD